MKPMVEDTVLRGSARSRAATSTSRTRSRRSGISESGLDELVAGIVSPNEGRVSFRASFPEVSVRVVVRGQPD